MNQNPKFSCGVCHTIFEVQLNELKAFVGQLYSVVCPSCKNALNISVDPQWFAPVMPQTQQTSPDTKQQTSKPEATQIFFNREAKAPPKEGLKPFLVLTQSQYHTQQKFKLQEGKFTVGRSKNSIDGNDADIAFITTDEYISQKHCTITVKFVNNNYNLLLQDNSKNGTFYNGSTDQHKLSFGDTVYLKDQDFINLGLSRAIIIFE